MDQSPEYRPTRIALVGLSTLVDGIVTVVLERSPEQFEICARLLATDDLRGVFETSGADVMVCAMPDDRLRSSWSAALAAQPSMAVMNLVDDERAARLYALRPEVSAVAELDTRTLLADPFRASVPGARSTLDYWFGRLLMALDVPGARPDRRGQ